MKKKFLVQAQLIPVCRLCQTNPILFVYYANSDIILFKFCAHQTFEVYFLSVLASLIIG